MPKKDSSPFSARKRLIVVAISACFASAPAWGNPTAPQVVNGSASFNQAGKLLTVTNSNGAIINWNSFSIGANETTRFNQASAASSVLNRVIANDPSVLLGTLSSNGKVWLVNPAGIMVGQGARIDVAGFIASTLNVRNEDFLAGRLNFGATPNAGSIQNYGQITTPSGGSIYLVAPEVENHGIINAPNGEVILAAGQTAQLIDSGTPGVKVDITGAEGNVTNLGEIVAEAGRIGMAGVLVRNSGALNASSVVREGGRIFLKASQDAYVDGAGRIVTTGTKGGSVEVLGNRVAVMNQAQLDASGNTGGGQILVGGDLQGKNADVQNASVTYFGAQASLKADATQSGDGGKVIVWADDTTRAYGNISARGGADGGNGGFVETSGHRYLDFRGHVDTSAPRGKAGSLLLDPADLNISYGGTTWSDPYITSYGGTANYGGTTGVFGGATGTATLYWETIDNQLLATNVVVTTSGADGSGDMNILSGHTYSSANSLSLLAHRNISNTNSSFNLINNSTGNISLVSGWNDASGTTAPTAINGNGSIAWSGAIKTGGSVSLTAGSAVSVGGDIDTSGGNITINAGNQSSLGIDIYGRLTANGVSSRVQGGNVSLIADGSIAFSTPYGGVISADGYGGGVRADGGEILIQSRYGSINFNDISTSPPGGRITANGAGNGGYGGSIEITLGNAYGGGVLSTMGYGGSITFSSGFSAPVMQANGANSTVYGANGGLGGKIRISTALASTGGGITYYGGLSANGGSGFQGSYGGGVGGSGGKGGNITFETGSVGNITFLAGSSINANGGVGATGGTGSGGVGGAGGTGGGGGSVTVEVTAPSTPQSIAVDYIRARGGSQGGGGGGSVSGADGTGGSGGTILFRHGGSAGGSVSMGSGDARASDGSFGSITMRADGGDLTVNEVSTPFDNLFLHAPLGKVLAGTAGTNATAQSIQVTAQSGIGTSSAPLKVYESYEQEPASLHFANTTGDVHISSDYALHVDDGINHGGSIFLTSTGLAGSGTSNDGSRIELNGTLANANVTASGNVVYTADSLLVLNPAGDYGNTSTSGVGSFVHWKPYNSNAVMALSSTASWLQKMQTPQFILGDVAKAATINVGATDLTAYGGGIGKLTLATSSSGSVNVTSTVGRAAAVVVDAGRFTLSGGTWEQVSGTLPGFTVNDFRITGGTFIRALGGDGGSTTPYQLADIYGVQGMGSSGMLGKSYALANNIDASGTVNWNAGTGFAPVGDLSNPFTGQFDGSNRTITNLFISRVSSNYVGLFGYIGTDGMVSNVGLVDVDITGDSRVGGLAGYNGGSIVNAYATGVVNSWSNNIGGLVGYNDGSISGAYATATVDGCDDGCINNVGGLVGHNEGSISNAYATGSVYGGNYVGGLVGENFGTIDKSYSTGVVNSSGGNVGGLVGYDEMGCCITKSYWDTVTSGQGDLFDNRGTGKSADEMKLLATFIDWSIADTGASGATWRIYEGNTAPLLRSFLKSLTVTATADSRTFNGSVYSGGNGVTYSPVASPVLSGSLAFSGTSQGAVNAGSYVLTPSGYFSDQQGYDISYANGALTINPYMVSLSGSRVYDGTLNVAAGALTLGTLVGSETLTLTGTGTVANKNAGAAKAVTLGTLALGNGTGLASNYTFSGGTHAANITQAALTLSTTDVTKTYDGGLAATGAAVVTSGTLFSGDTLSGGSFAFTDKNAGIDNKTVTTTDVAVNDGNSGSNYNVSYTNNTTSTINPYTVSLSGSRVYDGTPDVAAGALTLGTLVGSETLTLTGTGTLANKNAGAAKAVTLGTLALGNGTGLASNYSFSGGTHAASITARALTVVATGVSKVYDGLLSATAILSDNRVTSDVLTPGGSASYLDKNVGTAKTVNVNGITLTGADAGNYSFNTTAATSADITVRPLSTWIGGVTGDWSVAANWDALPDLSNVLAVSVPTGRSVTYDAAAGTTNLDSLTAAGLSITGGSLNIANGLTVNSSFSQTGGALGFGGSASASITQASGNLNVPAFTLASLSLNAAAGAITQSGPIVATTLNTQSQSGTTLTDAGNRVGNFTAANSGSGNIALTNTGALTITGLSNSGGDITIDNTGAVSTTGVVSAPAGAVSIVAHSPLTIGAGGVSAAGNITLTAGETADANDTLALDGPVNSTGGGGSIALFAGDDLAQNANVTSNGGAVSALSQTGNISMAPGTITSTGGGSIGYTATSGNVVLASLDAGSGAIALNAGGSIEPAAGFTGANLIGGSAVIVAGGSANLSTQVRLLDVTVEGTFSITDVLTGNVITDVPAPLPTTTEPVFDQVVSTVVAATQQQPEPTTTQIAPPTTTSGGSGPQLLSSSTQSIGGTADSFGGGSALDSLPATSAGTPSGGQSDQPAADKPSETKPADDKTASAKKDDTKAEDKKDDKKEKEEDKKKEEEGSAKKEDKPAAKKLATCS